MRIKFIKTLSVLLFASYCFIGCEKTDDFTGDSTLVPVAPEVTINFPYGKMTSLTEANTKYPFSISIAQPVEFDVIAKIEVLEGSATKGVDYEVPNEIFIKSGSTTGSAFIEFFGDDLAEEDEDFELLLASTTVNGTATPMKVKFKIKNLASGDLSIDLSWSLADYTTDNSGDEIDPRDFADLRLLITDSPNSTDIVDDADGGSFESIILNESVPNGTYYVVADFYSANEDIVRDIDLNVTFNQSGVATGPSYDFAGALNSAEQCSAAYFVLAEITKVGDSYSMAPVGEANSLDLANFVGTWSGEDMWGPTQVVTTLNSAGQLEITGIAVAFMTDGWGEEVLDMQTLTMDVNLETGEFTIAEAYYMETFYDGAVQPVYNLSATGTLSGTCSPKMDLVYDLVQDGKSYTDWLTQYDYVFHEILDLE